ncbi:MAG: hypothetical protein HGB32_16050 [Geobacteraceae bacterium]|nr:hypothetical protein [Geobacteraceae bacterium]NTW81632.1 hypothetical protein [Geobacteraceae bacterium]
MALKKDKTLNNGRTKRPVPKFENWFCKIFPKEITYPAWKELSKTATDVANICRAKSDHSAFCKIKGESGRPTFEFTATEAEKVFVIPRPTFSKAITSLIDIGFIEVVLHGGLANGKHISARYQLSERWKTWTPPTRDNTNMTKAREARKAAIEKRRLSNRVDIPEA